MKRRVIIALIGCVAGHHERPAVQHADGFLSSRSPEESAHLVAAFHNGLQELGFVEGQNLAIEYRWARGDPSLPRTLAAELVARRVNVLIAVGGGSSPRAAKAATSTIPIVFATGVDPVEEGLVESFNRPGGNATGYAIWTNYIESKRLGLLHELAPNVESYGALLNSSDAAFARRQLQELEEAARRIGKRLFTAYAGNDADLDAALGALSREQVGALLVSASAYFDTRRQRIIELAAQYRIPAIFHFREYVVDGGLMSYGPSATDAYRQIGIYAGRILKGASPGELPVMRATKFEFVVNLKTAKELGLAIPPTILSRADEVIE